MNKTTEPAALAGIEPIDYVYRGLDGLIYRTIPQDVLVVETIPRYSAATVERLVQERDMARDHANRLGEQLRAEARISDAQLAASQAREQQMREALERIMNPDNWGEDGCWNADSYPDEIAEISLALPQDDTALKAWGEKLLREIADGCRDGIDRAWITSKADELMEEKGNG